MRHDDTIRHELGNALGIVLANVEGMIDGLVSPTNERLQAVAEAIRRSRDLLNQLDEGPREQ